MIPKAGAPMQLINIKTGFVVVKYLEAKAFFNDRFLEKQMNIQGIVVPPFLQKQFNDKTVIFLKDPEFQKAFKEIYYLFSMNTKLFRWVSLL
jgi:hypothetical protein